MKIEIDGNVIDSVASFHANISRALNFPKHYGKNLDALFDILSTDIERPVTLIWKNSDISRRFIGADFDKILQVLHRVEDQDAKWGLEEKFKLSLV